MADPISIIALVVAGSVAVGLGVIKIIGLFSKDPETGKIQIRSSCCNFSNESEIQQGMRRNSSDIDRLAQKVHDLDEKNRKNRK